MTRYRIGLVAIALTGLALGLLAPLIQLGQWSGLVHTLATLPILFALLVEIVTSLRRGQVGLDLVAALSMGAALGFGESLAGNVVGLMYAGGQLLESFAEGQARREMTALLQRVARTAMREVDGRLEEVGIETLIAGDTLLIRPGETVPIDGRVASPSGASLDTAALTGEPLPRLHAEGEEAMSGATNAGDAFRLVALRPAAESTYAGIVRLVAAAQDSKAPVARLADRYAVVFLFVTLLIAGSAWALSGDHLRALAVLVVATPCPLILALPVALISGMSRAAKQGILIKTSGALERLWGIRTAILDKTGTLTRGEAVVTEIRTAAGFVADDVLRAAASLDQASGHVIAAALVREAKARGLVLGTPQWAEEAAGAGVSGMVEGVAVTVGGSRYVVERNSGDVAALEAGLVGESALVAVGIGGQVAGIVALSDPLRPETAGLVAGLRAAGIPRLVLASGDRQDVVDAVAGPLGLDALTGDLDPTQKLALVAAETRNAPTLMIGDGVNDAPALAAATLGIAMGARGSAASSETADIVLLVDNIDRVLAARRIANRTREIAAQSVFGGLSLSLIGMLAAALGHLPPVAGALVQEAIDVAVILNALRALR